MKATARVVELRLVESETQGLPPKYIASIVFRGNVAGSANVNVTSGLYARLQQALARGEHPELEVELLFDGC